MSLASDDCESPNKVVANPIVINLFMATPKNWLAE